MNRVRYTWALIPVAILLLPVAHIGNRPARGSQVKKNQLPRPHDFDVVRYMVESRWGRTIPPPGTISSRPWQGLDVHQQTQQVDAYNCFESVDYLTAGDPGCFAYRQWASEELQNPDDESSWDRLEKTLRAGDVVEFLVQVHGKNAMSSAFHAHVCAGEEALMVGANNEPHFNIIHGIPTQTQRWDVCTSREYYHALRSMDDAWRAVGMVQTYRIMIYRSPWFGGVGRGWGDLATLEARMIPLYSLHHEQSPQYQSPGGG